LAGLFATLMEKPAICRRNDVSSQSPNRLRRHYGPWINNDEGQTGTGRNPATEEIQIKASKKIAFRAAKELKEAI
jgi:hypothetical protein